MLVPMIYVKDKCDGHIHLVGTNQHDSLVVRENEEYEHATIVYRNMQNGCESGETYEFQGEQVEQGYDIVEYFVEMLPWEEAMEIYKQHAKNDPVANIALNENENRLFDELFAGFGEKCTNTTKK